jgi:hypothetical protein
VHNISPPPPDILGGPDEQLAAMNGAAAQGSGPQTPGGAMDVEYANQIVSVEDRSSRSPLSLLALELMLRNCADAESQVTRSRPNT